MQIMNTELTKNKFKRTCDDDSYALGERSEEEKKEIESSTRSSNRRSLCVGDTIIFFTLLTLFAHYQINSSQIPYNFIR